MEKEIIHYKEHFKGKTVYCNCDDPYESNFFKYFALHFNDFQLKKLIATCYAGSPVANTQLSLFPDEPPEDKTTRSPHKIVITEIKDGAFDLNDIKTLLANKKNALTRLKGDGDFRSPECIELLKEADIVATNPPFSLFREYITQLIEYDKKFIVIGNLNAISYKEIFPLLKENKLWLGVSIHSGDRKFLVSKNIFDKTKIQGKYETNENGDYYVPVMGVRWFTNLDHKKRHEEIILYEHYTPEKYPMYDNYDAINIDKVTEIPCDYDRLMGVPISFMDKYCPEQFEIINLSRYIEDGNGMSKKFVEDYYAQGNKGQIKEGHPDLCYYDKNGKAVVPYMRILIRRKQTENGEKK
ncbi:MAG: adenine-specific methyltransferase EcoRI family protein [Treponema sp.]